MISEVDISDWIPTEQPVKLYSLPRDTVIKLPNYDDLIMFEHIDGMYSFCRMLTGDHINEVFHLSASTEVIPYAKKD